LAVDHFHAHGISPVRSTLAEAENDSAGDLDIVERSAGSDNSARKAGHIVEGSLTVADSDRGRSLLPGLLVNGLAVRAFTYSYRFQSHRPFGLPEVIRLAHQK
jgi:hypothetical protein